MQPEVVQRIKAVWVTLTIFTICSKDTKNPMNIKKNYGMAVVWISPQKIHGTWGQVTHVKNSESAVGQSESQCSSRGPHVRFQA